jgi:plasmid stability protein
MDTKPKRTTVYFDPGIHRALRLKAAETEQSVSDLVNDAVREALYEDAEDFEAFEARASEPSFSFADVVTDMKRRGAL